MLLANDLEQMSKMVWIMIGERELSISGGQKQRWHVRFYATLVEILLSAVDARSGTKAGLLQPLKRKRGRSNLVVTDSQLSIQAGGSLC